jgi:protein TonB
LAKAESEEKATPYEKIAEEPVIEQAKFDVAYLNNPAPIYPKMSRRQGEQGRVLLKVLVSEKGIAEQVQLETSSGFEKLDQAAVDVVKKWSFVPAKRSNQAISAYVLVPVKFSLNS